MLTSKLLHLSALVSLIPLVTIAKKSTKMPFKTNNCLKCGASFVPTKPNQIYCDSYTCKFTNIAEKPTNTPQSKKNEKQ